MSLSYLTQILRGSVIALGKKTLCGKHKFLLPAPHAWWEPWGPTVHRTPSLALPMPLCKLHGCPQLLHCRTVEKQPSWESCQK